MSTPTDEQYAVAAEIVAEMFQSSLAAMDKGYVGFYLHNRDMNLPVEEVTAISELIKAVQFEFGWCYCGECFGDDDDEDGGDGE